MTIDYIPGTTSNLVGDPAEGGAFSSGNKGEIAGANTAAASAATSATAAAASQTAAAQSATDLSAAEANAGLSAANAAASATAASASQSACSGFLGSISSVYDNFDDRYLGAKASEPTIDNDGNALIVGAMYFNSSTNLMKVYNGSAWQVTAVDSTTILLKAQNLADLPSVSTARTNLGLGTMALEAAADYALLAGATFTGDVTAPEFIGVLQGETVFKAKAGEALAKGDAVYVSGVSGNTPVVSKADANGANTYPAFGLAAATTSNNGTLDVITAGELKNFDTSGFSLGDTLYLSTTPGALTATPPTGEGSVIQNMGKVEREHASVGSILVVGSGRTAATPNLNDGNVFIGNSSNKAVTSSFNTLADARIANNIIDEDGFATNSATRAPSQQSVKAYVDAQVSAVPVGDITSVTAGTGLSNGGTTGDVTLNIDSTVVTKTGTQTLTNKTLTSSDINTPDIDGGTIDGTVIGGATPAAGSFTTLDTTGIALIKDRLQIGESQGGTTSLAALDIRGDNSEVGNFDASVSAGVMTVTSVTDATLAVGDVIYSANAIPANTFIKSFGTGTGGTGTYNLSQSFDLGPVTLRNSAKGNLTASFTNADTTLRAGQPLGTIEFNDADDTNDGVKGFLVCGSQDTTPSSYLAFGTHLDGGGEHAREVARLDEDGNFLLNTIISNNTLDHVELRADGEIKSASLDTGTITAGITTISGAGAASTDPTFIVDRTGTADGAILSLKAGGDANATFFSTSGNRLILCDSDNKGLKFTPSSIHPRTSTNGALDNSMDLGLSSSKFRNVYTNGIVFDEVAGNASSNTLDDYEEGTWTPEYKATTTNPVYTQDSHTAGRYTKVGNVVHAVGRIRTDSATNVGSGQLAITLPFSVLDDGSIDKQFGVLTVGEAKGFNANSFPHAGWASKATSLVYIVKRTTPHGQTQVLDSDAALATADNSNDLVFSITYLTD